MVLNLNFGTKVPSHVMLGISRPEEVPSTPQRTLSPLGEACSRVDLTAIHQILVMAHYMDDEFNNEVLTVKFGSLCFKHSSSVLLHLILCLVFCSCHSKNGHNKCEICWMQGNEVILHSAIKISRPLSNAILR